jgi:hypothetical protein
MMNIVKIIYTVGKYIRRQNSVKVKNVTKCEEDIPNLDKLIVSLLIRLLIGQLIIQTNYEGR